LWSINTINHELKTFTKKIAISDIGKYLQNEVKDQYITSVVFKLTKRDHKINTSYGDITNELAKNNITNQVWKT
jgi:UDP-N-acetylmuramate dehydrogenase